MTLGCFQNQVMRRKMDLVSTTNFISRPAVYLTFKNTFKSILTGHDLLRSTLCKTYFPRFMQKYMDFCKLCPAYKGLLLIELSLNQ